MSCIHKKDGQTVMERPHGADLANALNAQIKGAAAATSTTTASAECPSPTAMLSAVDSSCRRASTVNRSSSTPPCTATSHLGCGGGSSSSSISRSRRGPSRRCTTMSAVDSTSPEISNWACGGCERQTRSSVSLFSGVPHDGVLPCRRYVARVWFGLSRV